MGVEEVWASLSRNGLSRVDLQYRVRAPKQALVLQDGTGQRRKGLWQTTCFELFLGDPLQPSYREFNFSPGGDWAAYSFNAYRAGMRDEDLPAPPQIEGNWEGDDFVLNVRLSLHRLEERSSFSLAAVIEESNFGRSFWAASHAAEPDFHARHCFDSELPPLVQS
jgi:hypothetical protein